MVRYIDKKDMAKVLGVNVKTLEGLVRQGLPVRYLGSTIRFRPNEVEKWIRGQSKLLDIMQAAYTVRVTPPGIFELARLAQKSKIPRGLRLRLDADGRVFFVRGELLKWFFSFEPKNQIYQNETDRIESIVAVIKEEVGVQFNVQRCKFCNKDIIGEHCYICRQDLCSKPQCCGEILDGIERGGAPHRICPQCFDEYKTSFHHVLHPPLASSLREKG